VHSTKTALVDGPIASSISSRPTARRNPRDLSESLKGVISQTLCKKVGGGRVAAREILAHDAGAISNLIREARRSRSHRSIQTSKKLGMLTLNDALLELVEEEV